MPEQTRHSTHSRAPNRAPRLYVEATLGPDQTVELNARQAHYLVNVLRLGPGEAVMVFNGRDGEWRATIAQARRKTATLTCEVQIREQILPGDLHYLFAPLKSARLDYLAQKATEMGVARMTPVLTAHTAMRKINLERLAANTIEAAEQCGMITLPEIDAVQPLADCLRAWPSDRHLVFCDEAAAHSDPLKTLTSIGPGPVAVLIGPEGGFSKPERDMLLAKPFVTAISLGPRIMRADTAAVAALALVQAARGDWRR